MFKESDICLVKTKFIDQLGEIYLLMVWSKQQKILEIQKKDIHSFSS